MIARLRQINLLQPAGRDTETNSHQDRRWIGARACRHVRVQMSHPTRRWDRRGCVVRMSRSIVKPNAPERRANDQAEDARARVRSVGERTERRIRAVVAAFERELAE